jgi:hypothetical protein
MFVLFASCNVSQATGEDETWKRTALSAQAFPGHERALYIDIPSASNSVSNLMVRAFIGNAPWLRQLTDIMAHGAQRPTYLVVGSQSDALAYSALSEALASFKGKSLPELHIALIGSPQKAEKLRPMVEKLGAEYRVLPSPSGKL